MPQELPKKIKHNKKRNAGLLFEWLTRHIAEVVAFGEEGSDPDVYMEICLRYFDVSTDLGRELEVMRTLSERKYSKSNRDLAVQAISEFKKSVKKINHHTSNIEKSNLIKEINHIIGKDLYSIEVPSYRLYASIYGLIESIKENDNAEQAKFESLVLQNLIAEDVVPSNTFGDLSEEDKKLAQSDAVLSLMEKKVDEKYKGIMMTETQKDLMANWGAWLYGKLNDEVYRNLLEHHSESVIGILDNIMTGDDVNESDITRTSLSSIRDNYTKSAIKNLSLTALTEHVLEGLSMEKFQEEDDGENGEGE